MALAVSSGGAAPIASAQPLTTPVLAAVRLDDRGVVTRRGTQLFLHGRPYEFTGINAYELATLWGTNAGCGAQVETPALDSFFGSLRPDSMVRFWAFQHFAQCV